MLLLSDVELDSQQPACSQSAAEGMQPRLRSIHRAAQIGRATDVVCNYAACCVCIDLIDVLACLKCALWLPSLYADAVLANIITTGMQRILTAKKY